MTQEMENTSPVFRNNENRQNPGNNKAQRNYKDTLFRFIFNDKEKLLGLYNALNHSNYTNPDDLIINTLENAIYLTVKNDISFVFNSRIFLFEHQSTFCPNMPLRDLQYLSTILEGMLKDSDLCSGTLVKIPAPHFVVFYNGTEKKQDRMILKLSDAFEHQEEEPQLELLVTMININYGHNMELMDACKDLRDYSIYVAKIRKYMSGDFDISEEKDDESTENDIANQTKHGTIKEKSKKTKYKMTIEEAVDQAIDECIAEGVMVDILLMFKAEVKKMSIFEYNAQLHEETLKKEGFAKGLEIGFEDGFEDGCEVGFENGRFKELCELEEDGLLTLEQVAGRMGMTPEEFLKKKREEQVLV